MPYIFQVTIHYGNGSMSQLTIKARDDMIARDEAIKVDALNVPVSFCEIAFIGTLDNEE